MIINSENSAVIVGFVDHLTEQRFAKIIISSKIAKSELNNSAGSCIPDTDQTLCNLILMKRLQKLVVLLYQNQFSYVIGVSKQNYERKIDLVFTIFHP